MISNADIQSDLQRSNADLQSDPQRSDADLQSDPQRSDAERKSDRQRKRNKLLDRLKPTAGEYSFKCAGNCGAIISTQWPVEKRLCEHTNFKDRLVCGSCRATEPYHTDTLDIPNTAQYMCFIRGCKNYIIYKPPKERLTCGITQIVCEPCRKVGWRIISGHGGQTQSWLYPDYSGEVYDDNDDENWRKTHYRYKCPVESCQQMIVDEKPDKEYVWGDKEYLWGTPKHVCQICDRNGWCFATDHGCPPHLWRKVIW